jgi:polysaccharide pyruvyl transferase WcaK-like protein
VVAGAPTINLYYEPKGRDFFLALDAEDRLMDVNDLLSTDAENRLLDMVNRTLRDWPALRERTRSRLGPIQARARENAALLKQALIRRGLWPPKSPPHRT